MARVYTQKKSARGKPITCIVCNEPIAPGESYHQWGFRYGGTYNQHAEHGYPKRSALTQSKMADIYAAIETAEDTISEAENFEDITTAVQGVSEQVTTTAGEYREAAEHFGGAGENAERADELESWADELDGWESTEDIENFDEDTVGKELSQEMFGIDDPNELDRDDRMAWVDALQNKRDEFDAEEDDRNAVKIQEARSQAQEVLDSCPF